MRGHAAAAAPRRRRGDPLRRHPPAARADGRAVRVRRRAKGPVIHEPIAERAADRRAPRHRARGGARRTCSRRSARSSASSPGRCRSSASRARRSRSRATSSRGARSAHFAKTKKLMYGEPEAWSALMGKLARGRAALPARADRGRGGLRAALRLVGRATLSPDDYRDYVQPHVAHILAGRARRRACRSSTSGPGRARSSSSSATPGGTVIGVDWRTPLADAWDRDRLRPRGAGEHGPVRALRPARGRRTSTPSASSTRRRGRPGHIFNLGHGILPETPVDNVQAVIDYVHETSGGVR